MFDFAWTELAVVGVVALLVIGPKDLPAAIKAVGDVVRKARRMASEFQTHVDDMVKDANLNEVRDQINQIRNFDIKGALEKEIDSDGSIRSALSNPLDTTTATATSIGDTATPVGELPPDAASATPPDTTAEAAPPPEPEPEDTAPAFIPPAIAHPPEAPEFLPPRTARAHLARAASAQSPFG